MKALAPPLRQAWLSLSEQGASAAIDQVRRALLLLAGMALLLAGGVQAGPALPQLDLAVDLDPATRQLRVQATLKPNKQEFVFDLHESLTVDKATAAGKPLRVVAAGRDGALRRWRVQLPGGSESLQLDYGGTLSALAGQLDHRQVLRGLPPMASPEGSFLPSGGSWYPRPAAFFSYRVSLSVPGTQRALVAGRLVSEDAPASANAANASSASDPSSTAAKSKPYRASFEFLQPADGIDLMAGPWVIREKTMPGPGGKTLHLRTYFPADLDATPGLAEGYLDDTQRYIERYSRLIGAYPFSEFSVVASPLPTGLGMPTLTYLGADVLRLPFIRATSLGHEVLHNWWGNGVYVDYAQGNWSEGLTTFLADYAYKEESSPEAAREMRLAWLRDFAALPADQQPALVEFRSRTHGAAAAVGYSKSAMLFLMLRDRIGEKAFRQGLARFWSQQRFKVAGWKDLQNAFEAASGQPLADFFGQWLTRAGGPVPHITEARVQSRAGKLHLQLDIAQESPPWTLRLPVELVYAGRSETRWVDIREARSQVVLPLAAAPQGVRLDPQQRVWRRLPPDQLPPILRQWIGARAPRLVIAGSHGAVREAAEALARRVFEATPRVTPLGEALRQEAPLISLEEARPEPVLIIGLHGEVDALLAANGLPPRPAMLAGRGSAQVWTVQRSQGPPSPPVAVVSGKDAAALAALQRPLPHYGGQSWLAFEGSKAVERGVWPAAGPLVPVQRPD